MNKKSVRLHHRGFFLDHQGSFRTQHRERNWRIDDSCLFSLFYGAYRCTALPMMVYRSLLLFFLLLLQLVLFPPRVLLCVHPLGVFSSALSPFVRRPIENHSENKVPIITDPNNCILRAVDFVPWNHKNKWRERGRDSKKK